MFILVYVCICVCVRYDSICINCYRNKEKVDEIKFFLFTGEWEIGKKKSWRTFFKIFNVCVEFAGFEKVSR